MSYNLQPSYNNVDELETRDKAINVLYGRRASDGTLLPISIDDNGHLVIGTGIVLSPQDIRLGAVEIQDNDSNNRVDVIPIGDTIVLPPLPNPDNYRGLLILGKGASNVACPLSFDVSGALIVTATSPTASNGFNNFGTNSTLDSLWTSVVSKTILISQTLCVEGFNVWGDSDAEWTLLKTSGQIGGTRTSPSKVSDIINFTQPIQVVGPDTVTLKVKHFYTGKTINFYSNLFGRIT